MSLENMDLEFALGLLKGMIEHKDGTKYFGSTAAYSFWFEEAKKLGLVRGEKSWEGKPTKYGREIYKKMKLTDLPHNGRIYMWKWDSIDFSIIRGERKLHRGKR